MPGGRKPRTHALLRRRCAHATACAAARRAALLPGMPRDGRQAGSCLKHVKHSGAPQAAAFPRPCDHMRGAGPAWCAVSGASASCRKCSAARPCRAAACQSSTDAAQPAPPAARARVRRSGAPAARRHARSPAARATCGVCQPCASPPHACALVADGRSGRDWSAAFAFSPYLVGQKLAPAAGGSQGAMASNSSQPRQPPGDPLTPMSCRNPAPRP